MPTIESGTTATFADDTAILAVGKTNEEATEKLQMATNQVNRWTRKWRIRLNETKSVHVNFTNKNTQHIIVNINNKQILYSNTAKYLGFTLDAKLRWKAYAKKKREELGLKFRKMYWLIGRKSTLFLHNKLLLYKQLLKPVWTYGAQLWGCTKQSNRDIIQRFQNKVLRSIVDYIRNSDLLRDLEMETVDNTIKKFAKSHEDQLHQHVNPEAIQLLDNSQLV